MRGDTGRGRYHNLSVTLKNVSIPLHKENTKALGISTIKLLFGAATFAVTTSAAVFYAYLSTKNNYMLEPLAASVLLTLLGIVIGGFTPDLYQSYKKEVATFRESKKYIKEIKAELRCMDIMTANFIKDHGGYQEALNYAKAHGSATARIGTNQNNHHEIWLLLSSKHGERYRDDNREPTKRPRRAHHGSGSQPSP